MNGVGPDAVPFALPLRTRFRGIDVREGVLLRGPHGWAEFSPFVEYDDAEARSWWASAVEAAEQGWPDPVRDHVPVNATVPAVDATEVAGVLARFPGSGTAKVKVGPATDPAAVDRELDRLRAVRDALGPAGAIRVDVNAGWDLDTALRLLPRYDDAAGGLEYAEQPCADVDDLAVLRRRGSVPIAADESIRRAEDPLRVLRAGAADVAVLKVQPLGGVRACLRLAETLDAAGVPVVVSSALETSVGIAAGVALAAALPSLPYACGLATVGLLARDVVTDPLIARDGALPVTRPAPDPGLLAAAAPSAERATWWAARVDRVRTLARSVS